jgi:hypothetical protein
MACINRAWVSGKYEARGNNRANTALEGDVEGVMDRPIGNTPEVHAECEKWYVECRSQALYIHTPY